MDRQMVFPGGSIMWTDLFSGGSNHEDNNDRLLFCHQANIVCAACRS